MPPDVAGLLAQRTCLRRLQLQVDSSMPASVVRAAAGLAELLELQLECGGSQGGGPVVLEHLHEALPQLEHLGLRLRFKRQPDSLPAVVLPAIAAFPRMKTFNVADSSLHHRLKPCVQVGMRTGESTWLKALP
jgi:hypothetical protein